MRELDNGLLQPETLIYKMNNELGLSAELLTKSVKICGKLKNKTSNPKTIAVTAIYLSAKKSTTLKNYQKNAV